MSLEHDVVRRSVRIGLDPDISDHGSPDLPVRFPPKPFYCLFLDARQGDGWAARIRLPRPSRARRGQ